jgi:ABC-2 type transport system ATP-binding protein
MNYPIHFRGLSKSYGNTQAIDDLGFEVNNSELFGIIGPDGAGKTTLIRILTTLILPDKGEATIDGFNVKTHYRNIRSIIGYMPGKFSLYQDLSIEENLNFFAMVFGTTVEKNYQLIKPIYEQIEPFKKRRAGKLSGGMKQKLALCCALIHRPKVLFLDEPTTGVDAVSRKEFWEMLKEIKNNGITILVSTPYMDEADKCDRISLMLKGRIIGIDTPKGLTRQFYGQLFEIQIQNLYSVIQQLRQCPTCLSAIAFGQVIHYRDKRFIYSVEEIDLYLKSNGYYAQIIREIEPSIEDCFIAFSENVSN